VLHRWNIVNIRGNSYRMRHHSEVWKALHLQVSEDLSEEAPTN
jgi:hypothetical protein